MPDDATSLKTTSRPKRRRFRYSLRTFLIVVTAICLWLGWKIRAAREQQRTIAAIQELEGGIDYDFEWEDISADRVPPEPAWLVKLLGVDFLHDVVEVQSNTGFVGVPKKECSKLLAQLGHFPHLHCVIVDYCILHDEDLQNLTELTELKALNLTDSGISDVGLQHLRNLNRMSALHVSENHISDKGLLYLASLISLEELDLSKNQISGEGFLHLVKLRNLRWLGIDDNPITDEGLKIIARLPHLETLLLDHSDITNAGLEHLQGVSSLKHLSLISTRVSDTGIESLLKMPSLNTLDISGTRITAEGISRLKRMQPKLDLRLSPGR